MEINIFSCTTPEQFSRYICHEMLIFKNIGEACLQHGRFSIISIALYLRRTLKLSALLELTFRDQIVKYLQPLIDLLIYELYPAKSCFHNANNFVHFRILHLGKFAAIKIQNKP